MHPEKTPTNPQTKSSQMMKKNLILAGTLAGLSAFALWYEFKQKPALEKRETEKKKIYSVLSEKEISEVRIFNGSLPGDPAFEIQAACIQNCKLNGSNSEWNLTKPLSFRGDSSTFSGLVNSFNHMTPSEKIDIQGFDDGVLKNFSLDATKRTLKYIEFKFKDVSEPVTLYVGDRAPVGNALYVLAKGPGVEDKFIYMVPDTFGAYLDKKLSAYRNKKVFHIPENELNLIRIEGKNGPVELKKEKGQTSWKLAPDWQEADSNTVETFIASILDLSVTDYVSDDKKADRRKLDMPSKPQFRITLSSETTPTTIEAFENNRKPADYFLENSTQPFIAKTDLGNYQKLSKKRDDFRIKSLLLPAEKYNIQTLRIKIPGTTPLEIKQDKGQWISSQITNLQSGPLDNLLSDIGAARIEAFLGKSKPAGKEAGSYELMSSEGKLIRSMKFFKDGKNKEEIFYVQLGTGEYVRLAKDPNKNPLIRLISKKEELTPAPPEGKK